MEQLWEKDDYRILQDDLEQAWVLVTISGGCTPRATRAMARGSAQKIAEEVQKNVEEE